MSVVNDCKFIGRLTRDPECRTTSGGKSVGEFSIAVNGFKKDDATFIDCTAWEKDADFLRDNVRKGDMVAINAEVYTDKWTDKETGNPRSKQLYKVRGLQALILKKWTDKAAGAAADEDEGDEAPPARPAKAAKATKPKTPPPFDPDDDLEDEDEGNIGF